MTIIPSPAARPIDVPLIATARSTAGGREEHRRMARSIRVEPRARRAEQADPRVPAAAAVRRRENILRAAADQLRSMKPALMMSWRFPLCWFASGPVSLGRSGFAAKIIAPRKPIYSTEGAPHTTCV
jgi:hypothetical protein